MNLRKSDLRLSGVVIITPPEERALITRLCSATVEATSLPSSRVNVMCESILGKTRPKHLRSTFALMSISCAGTTAVTRRLPLPSVRESATSGMMIVVLPAPMIIWCTQLPPERTVPTMSSTISTCNPKQSGALRSTQEHSEALRRMGDDVLDETHLPQSRAIRCHQG